MIVGILVSIWGLALCICMIQSLLTVRESWRLWRADKFTDNLFETMFGYFLGGRNEGF